MHVLNIAYATVRAQQYIECFLIRLQSS
jgi:hypothetical protein